jgi:hypothetical protein
MDVNALLLTLLIGAVAGWFAGQLVQAGLACLAKFSSALSVRWLLPPYFRLSV